MLELMMFIIINESHIKYAQSTFAFVVDESVMQAQIYLYGTSCTCDRFSFT